MSIVVWKVMRRLPKPMLLVFLFRADGRGVPRLASVLFNLFAVISAS